MDNQTDDKDNNKTTVKNTDMKLDSDKNVTVFITSATREKLTGDE